MIGGTTKLQIVLQAVDRASKELKGVSKNLDKAGNSSKKASKKFGMSEKSLRRLKIGATIAGVAIAGLAIKIGKDAVQAATTFETSMGNVATIVDTSTESMEEMGKKVREIAKRVPKDLSELTEGLYNVRSAGISAEEAMDVLETSAKLATAGLSTTDEAVNLLTSAINVYGDESHDANKIADILFKTVKYGKTTVAGLAQGFGKVAAIAKETGLSIEDLSAATAVLTTTGVKAAEAQTAIKAAIANVLKPTKDAEDAAKKLGIEFNLSALQAKGLSGMMLEISEAAGDDKQALADLFGSVEAANAIFVLASEDGGTKMRDIIGDMTTGTNALNDAFAKQNATMAAQVQIMKNQLNDLMLDLGSKILPVVMKAVEGLNLLLGGLNQNLKNVQENTKSMAQDVMDRAKIAIEEGDIEMADRLMKAARAAYSQEYGSTKITPIDILKGGFKSPKELLTFHQGGIVPGPPGESVPAVVRGGERVIPENESGGGNNFAFDFRGAFIGNVDEFKGQIIRLINRESELRSLGGI